MESQGPRLQQHRIQNTYKTSNPDPNSKGRVVDIQYAVMFWEDLRGWRRIVAVILFNCFTLERPILIQYLSTIYSRGNDSMVGSLRHLL